MPIDKTIFPTEAEILAAGPSSRSHPPVFEQDFAAVEKRIMARMTAINGAAEHVVERFQELTKTESGTPLFKHKFRDGSLTPTGRLLFNLVVEAIQGEVML